MFFIMPARSNAIRRAKAANRPSELRQKLLDVSARRFVERGVANVSVEELIEAAGISRATFYGLFKNKHELASALLLPVFDSGIKALVKLRTTTPRQAANQLFPIYLQLWHEHRNALLLTGNFDKAVFPLIKSRHNAFNHELEKVLQLIDTENLLRNGSVEQSIEVLAKTGIPLLRIYKDRADFERVYTDSMLALLMIA